MSKKARIIAAVVALVVVAVVVAFFALSSGASGPEIETASVAQQELAVTVSASGKVESGVSADVFPPTSGTLDEVLVTDGDTVEAGDEIARMDTGPIELQVAQAKAGLSQARAQLAAIDDQAPGTSDLTAARANVDATRNSYEAAKQSAAAVGDQAPSDAQIAAAEAATRAARTSYENARAAWEAYPSDDATKAALAAAKDQAYAGYLAAKAAEDQLKNTDLSAAQAQADAAVQGAYAAYKGAQAQLAALEGADTSAARKAAQAAVRQADDALTLAEQVLDDATMRAPIDGVVIFNSGSASAAALTGGASTGGELGEGSAVSPASAPFTVVDLDGLKFMAEVDEADVERIDIDMVADVSLDAFPGEEFASKVVRINPVAQTTTTGGTVFEVEILLEDLAQDILIGMKGDATIKVSSQPNALTIPVEALFSEAGTDYVYVVESGQLAKTEITVGATTDTDVEILGGLAEGQVVALSGSVQYTDGMAVREPQ